MSNRAFHGNIQDFSPFFPGIVPLPENSVVQTFTASVSPQPKTHCYEILCTFSPLTFNGEFN